MTNLLTCICLGSHNKLLENWLNTLQSTQNINTGMNLSERDFNLIHISLSTLMLPVGSSQLMKSVQGSLVDALDNNIIKAMKKKLLLLKDTLGLNQEEKKLALKLGARNTEAKSVEEQDGKIDSAFFVSAEAVKNKMKKACVDFLIKGKFNFNKQWNSAIYDLADNYNRLFHQTIYQELYSILLKKQENKFSNKIKGKGKGKGFNFDEIKRFLLLGYNDQSGMVTLEMVNTIYNKLQQLMSDDHIDNKKQTAYALHQDVNNGIMRVLTDIKKGDGPTYQLSDLQLLIDRYKKYAELDGLNNQQRGEQRFVPNASVQESLQAINTQLSKSVSNLDPRESSQNSENIVKAGLHLNPASKDTLTCIPL